MSDPLLRPTFGDLARQALAAAPAARSPLLMQLAHAARSPEHLVAIADLLFAGGKHGPAIALEWLVRTSSRLPAELVERFVPLLAERAVPVNLRIAAAARLLRDLPDASDAVRPLAKALTAGLSPLRSVERLRQLQHQLDRSRALDHLIERRDARVVVDCPRCSARLSREAMVKHLWFVHGSFLHDGKVHDPERLIDGHRTAFAESGDPACIDRAALLAGERAHERLCEWAAAGLRAADAAPLLAEAEAHECGLCPRCLAEVSAPIAPMPPPLTINRGRLIGEGNAVAIGGPPWLRTVRATAADKVLRSGPDRRGQILSPRGVGTLIASIFLCVAAFAALTIPRERLAPLPIAAGGIAAAVIGYAIVQFTRRPHASPDDRAVDVAWSVHARRCLQREGGTRYLTRLARASIGRGTPLERVGILNRIVENHDATEAMNATLRLVAAVRVLQIEDAARQRLAALAALAGESFRGERSIVFAEYVAACFEPREPADPVRFQLLLIAAAFDGGLRPKDLIDLWVVAPQIRGAMAVEPLYQLGLLFGTWSLRNSRPWERAGRAETAFELARTAEGGRVLQQFPDLLLAHELEAEAHADLGPVLVCGRGVVVGGVRFANPDAEVRIAKSARGTFELHVGRQHIALSHRPAADLAERIRAWLQVRAKLLLPFIDGYLDPSPAAVSKRVLGPFHRECWHCGATSAIASGKLGLALS